MGNIIGSVHCVDLFRRDIRRAIVDVAALK